MATSTSAATKSVVNSHILQHTRTKKGARNDGVYVIKGSKAFDPSDYNTADDYWDIMSFGAHTYFLGATISCEDSLDSGIDALRVNLVSTAHDLNDYILDESADGLTDFQTAASDVNIWHPGTDLSERSLSFRVVEPADTPSTGATLLFTVVIWVDAVGNIDLGAV